VCEVARDGRARDAGADDHDVRLLGQRAGHVLQRRVEGAVAERLEAERHARLPLHLLTRALAAADALAPGNPTHVHQLDSSHSPFMSQPAVLAGMLADIAKS
jgi:hypothetical protein